MRGVPIGAIVVAVLFGSALLGMAAARLLPKHHLDTDTKNVVSVSMAVIGTLSALVLGLLISTANTSFSTKAREVTQVSADIIRLDRLLRRYGPEAQDIRVLLRRYTAARLQDLFPENSTQPANLANDASISLLEELENKVLALTPASDAQRWLQAQALQLTGALEDTRWQLVQESASKTPQLLMVLVLFWFILIFFSFGLFAPRNMTAIAIILLCSMGVGSAIRMTTELQIPFQGLIRISSTPMTDALETINR
jgi:hypothetical protein